MHFFFLSDTASTVSSAYIFVYFYPDKIPLMSTVANLHAC